MSCNFDGLRGEFRQRPRIMTLVQLREERGDLPLAEGVIERV